MFFFVGNLAMDEVLFWVAKMFIIDLLAPRRESKNSGV